MLSIVDHDMRIGCNHLRNWWFSWKNMDCTPWYTVLIIIQWNYSERRPRFQGHCWKVHATLEERPLLWLWHPTDLIIMKLESENSTCTRNRNNLVIKLENPSFSRFKDDDLPISMSFPGRFPSPPSTSMTKDQGIVYKLECWYWLYRNIYPFYEQLEILQNHLTCTDLVSHDCGYVLGALERRPPAWECLVCATDASWQSWHRGSHVSLTRTLRCPQRFWWKIPAVMALYQLQVRITPYMNSTIPLISSYT